MKFYVAYIRVSTKGQGTHGSSLPEQRDAIEQYAHRNGLDITRWYEEQQTAAKSGRRIFQRMLKDVEKAKATGIIVHKIDRSARNLRDWADLNELIDHGLEVHFAHDALDLTSRGGRLSADIQAVVAADFIRNLREETRKGFYGRLKQGLYPLRAPIGYLDKGKGQVKVPDPEKAPLVRHAFELYATGDYNFERLRDELHRCGLRGWHGSKISLNGLTTLLNNPFYMGLIHIRKTNEMFQGQHEPLIRKSLYDRVQVVLRGGKLSGGAKHDFLYRKVVRCGACGNHLIAECQKGRYVYYRCHQAGHACVSEAAIDRVVSDDLQLLGLSEEEVGDVRDLVAEYDENHAERTKEREAALKLQIARTADRLSRLTDALLDGLIDKDTFNERKERALKDRVALMERVADTPNTIPFAQYVEENVELANTAYLQYESGDMYFKRELLTKLTSNFVAQGKTLVFVPYSPFRELLQYRKSSDCDHHRDSRRTQAEKIFQILWRAAEAEMDKRRLPREAERRMYVSEGSPQSPEVHGMTMR